MGYRILFFCLLLPSCLVAGEEKPPEEKTLLRAQLENPIALDVLETTLENGLETLAKQAGVKVFIEKTQDEVWLAPVDFKLEDARPIDLLQMLCDLYDLQYTLQARGVVVERRKPQAAASVTMCVYDVDDLCADLGTASGPDNFPDSDALPDIDPPDVAPTLTNIGDMIRNRVRPETWDAALGTSIEERGGKLVVMQTVEVHGEIRRLLGVFRAKQNRQVAVDCRFLSVNSIAFDRIREEASARGVAAPTLDDAALKALQDLVRAGTASQIFSGHGLGFNLRTCWIQNLRETRALNDYDIVGDNYDPVVRTRFTGASLLYRPVLSDDGSTVALSLRATRNELLGSEDIPISRPGVASKHEAQDSTITVKQKKAKTKEPKNENEPNGAEGEEEGQVEDVTSEFEIEQKGIGTTTSVAVPGPLHCQLQTFGFSRLAQFVRMRTGQWSAFSAPLHGAHGVEPGRELVVLVRANLVRVGNEQTSASPIPLPAPKENISEMLAKRLAQKLTLKLNNIPLQVAVERLAEEAHLPLFIAQQSVDHPIRGMLVSIDAKEEPVGDVLRKVLHSSACETRSYQSVMLIAEKKQGEGLARNVVLRMHDIRDMTAHADDYPGNMHFLPGDAREQRPVVACVFGSAPTTGGFRAEDFAILLKERIFPEDFASPETSMEESGGRLVVMNTADVQEKIAAKLNAMRRELRPWIGLTARWAVVDTANLDAAFDGNPPPVLDAAGAKKALGLIAANGSRDLASARFVCEPGQRVAVSGGTHRDSIVDYDVSGAVHDPVLRGYECGAMADLRPRIAADADGTSHISLETRLMFSRPDLKPKRWNLLGSAEKPALGHAAGTGLVEHSANEYSRVWTNVAFPSGGAALFRMTPPEWIEGEAVEAIRKGDRTLIVVIQGTLQRLGEK